MPIRLDLPRDRGDPRRASARHQADAVEGDREVVQVGRGSGVSSFEPRSRRGGGMSVADQLRGAREYLGLPIGYIAEESGLGAEVIEAFETGEREPTDLELRRLGRVLGYTVAYFRGDTSSLEPEELEAVAR